MTPGYVIYPYDCVDAMLHLVDPGSVHCVVTSPPYYNLRDYKHDGQIGHEATPGEYVAAIVRVARAVRQVLRDDGTFWLNLGDTYASRSSYNAPQSLHQAQGWKQAGRSPNAGVPAGLKEKEMMGIPWRVALALQADGWYIRNDIIWAKPNPTPESVRDRFTKSHEHLFFLSKSPRYFFDQLAVMEPAKYGWRGSEFHTGKTGEHQLGRAQVRASVPQGGFEGKGPIPGRENQAFRAVTEMRNRRDVWTISAKPFKQAHFATFPVDLIEPCILAGSPPSCCSACGAPRAPVVERTPMRIERTGRGEAMGGHGRTQPSGTMRVPATSRLVGYRPTCECGAADAPAIVLDPFGGSGTVAVAALRHGRSAVLCELNPEYVAMAHERIAAGK
jgi:site-specific DNA-methyltransferase (adenine-specific)